MEEKYYLTISCSNFKAEQFKVRVTTQKNRRNSFSCTMRISSQRSCNQRVVSLLCAIWGEGLLASELTS